MIRITDLKMPVDFTDKALLNAAAKALGIGCNSITGLSVFKKSVDARKKNDICFNITVDITTDGNEKKLVNKCRSTKITLTQPYEYKMPDGKPLSERPVIAGAGPAGLFCAYILAACGDRPIILERGKCIDERVADVNAFHSGGKLNVNSNVQFGEGGAGTFSDGKLNTGTKDTRARAVLQEFVRCGAPEEILYSAKPHIGTDKLRITIKNLRNKIIGMGGEFRFGAKLTDINIKNGLVSSIEYVTSDGQAESIETDSLILAVGHSARDTFEMIYGKGAAIEPKPFSVGARIEHKREFIDKAQYGKFAGNKHLGAADYKLFAHLPNGRCVYTFCMCPGGTVVAAASEENMLVTNGMSEFARSAENSNSALLVSVSPDDYGSEHPLAGMYFQRRIEQKAFVAGGGNYHAPIQRAGDLLADRGSTHIGDIKPSYTPGFQPSDLSDCLPKYVIESMKAGISEFDKRIKGFAMPDAVLTGVETRSSSPIRIMRGDDLQSVNIKGLYPCGEGAGYAGGIISAAVDGIKTAEQVHRKSQNTSEH